MTSRRILAIDPGTREIGVAVLEGSELLFYAVKTIRDRTTAQRVLAQAAEITARLIEDYGPECLAIEKMFVVQKSAALLSVTAEEIKSVARHSGLPIHEYAPSTIRKFVCQSDSAKKRDVARVIAGAFPELAKHLNTRNKWDEQYYANIFDAIAVGLRCYFDLTGESFWSPRDVVSEAA